jgi:hypothetical protein
MVTAPSSAYAGRIGFRINSGNIFGVALVPAGIITSVTLNAQIPIAIDSTINVSVCGSVLGGSLPVRIDAPAETQWLRYTLLKVPT